VDGNAASGVGALRKSQNGSCEDERQIVKILSDPGIYVRMECVNVTLSEHYFSFGRLLGAAFTTEAACDPLI